MQDFVFNLDLHGLGRQFIFFEINQSLFLKKNMKLLGVLLRETVTSKRIGFFPIKHSTHTRVSKEPRCRLGLPIRLGVDRHSQRLSLWWRVDR